MSPDASDANAQEDDIVASNMGKYFDGHLAAYNGCTGAAQDSEKGYRGDGPTACERNTGTAQDTCPLLAAAQESNARGASSDVHNSLATEHVESVADLLEHFEVGVAIASSASAAQAAEFGNAGLIRCERCDQIGHTADACPFFASGRADHSDASWGDTVPHLQQTQISITSNGNIVERSQLQPGWWEGQRVEVSVNNHWFVLGKASGEGCNCLIDTLRQLLPTTMCNVSSIRAELERLHAGSASAIVPSDY